MDEKKKTAGGLPDHGWNREALFSTTGSEGRGDWRTPQALFDHLDREFGFDLDAAASDGNALCRSWITAEEDALTVDWYERIRSVRQGARRAGSEWPIRVTPTPAIWLNPPYGRGLDAWIKKAYEESLKGCAVVVLIFARTDTRWWQDWAMKAAQVRLIRGRVHFEVGGKRGPSPAPSCVLVFSELLRVPTFTGVGYPRGMTCKSLEAAKARLDARLEDGS